MGTIARAEQRWCFLHLPYHSTDPTPSKMIVEVINYCTERSLTLVFGCDSKYHLVVWRSSDDNPRGRVLHLGTTNLMLLDKADELVFLIKRSQETIDFAPCFSEMVSEV
jgi:hypothetical protein